MTRPGTVEGVYFVSTSSAESLHLWLRSEGIACIEFPGETVRNIASFFRVAKDRLPLNPELSGQVNIDAFSDSLWQGVADLEAARVAVVWSCADIMLNAAPDDFFTVLTQIHLVAESLRLQPPCGHNEAVQLDLYLLGLGNGFRSLEELGIL